MANAALRLIPGASPALRRLLDPARGAVEPPIRAEIFGPQRFAEHGRSLGATHRAAHAAFGAPTFFPRLRSNIDTLREAQRHIAAQAFAGHHISPAAEWLLDNFHLVEAQLEQIHVGLPRSYYRTLPVLLDAPLAGLPRVYGVAWAFVAHTDGEFDEALLVQFLLAYQRTRELDLSEMWALPTTLRVLLVENLRRLAERLATHKAAREAANLCCDDLARCSVATLDRLLALLVRRGVGDIFLGQIAQRLHGRAAGADLPAGVEAWLQAALPDPAARQTQLNAEQTADNLSVSNAVRSLRAIGDADWPGIVARTSTLMQRMLGAPGFAAEDDDTRGESLRAIERLARRSGHTELAVAQALLALMRTDTAAVAVPGHWLQGAGRPALAQALGLDERAAQAWRAAAGSLALPAYLAVLLLGTWGLLAWLLHLPAPGSWALPVAALMALPASEAVLAVLNRLVSELVRPGHLPRLAHADGIPPECRTMVAIPALLGSTASTQALVHGLHLHYLANPQAQAQFALLSDWPDADAAQTAADAALLDDAARAIDALNARHPPAGAGAAPRFLLLHRERRYSASEGRWIGWERKRGKLEQLVATLAGASAPAFVDLGPASRIAAGTRYVLTLDSDTQLPPGRLRELVAVAAHPHNQPRLDASRRRVVGGYAILQPRIVTPLPARGQATPYHWLFAGRCGIDPYSSASSEVYQDLFGEGSFSGKGLLDVAAVHAVLAGRLPEDRVLSHDLLEGAVARCAVVNDITLIEEAPFHADVAASRVHRWMRGDWQLLPFLLFPWRLPLSALNRWKLFDNLRRSLVAPASLALLLLALAGVGLAPAAAVALVLAAFSAGPLMGALTGFVPSRRHIAWRHFYAQAAGDLARALGAGLWHLAQLLAQALQALDAIARALYRLVVSHRHLLQWTTAAAAQAGASRGLAATLRGHAGESVAALALLGALLAAGSPHPALALVLTLAWAASPLTSWWISRPHAARADAALAPPARAYLLALARDTWRWFERCVGPDDNDLPPDNLQMAPHEMLAHRTSPTNIGLYLLAVACAREFGWIDCAALLARMEATLATLGRLQRHRGHFLNWYDTQTLAPLLPMYVSTVDSGNLCGHLLGVAQACRELARAPAQHESAARLCALADAFQALAWQPDFGFLYHRTRHLFHIGYRVAEQELDAGLYDLLASESRLTSLFAIAKGDVPARHWAALGRPFFAVGTVAGLRSWSGSMFEYLMPSLVLDEPPGSVLHDACRAALREQIAFAEPQHLPWGLSESAYAGRDHTLAYQYAPQGVPRLALRRTPPDERVIAPYATALATQIAPRRAWRNFGRLEALVPHGELGFIEALDFTPARQVGAGAFTPVDTYMAHHQGMTLVALANLLLDGPARRWTMADERIEAMASLLHERSPREVSRLAAPPPPALPPLALQARAPGLVRDLLPGAAAVEPTQLLSNGRYTVALRANGAGFSRRGTTGITRWRDDALRDAHGSFFYLRWDRQPQPVSITQHPAPDPAAHYRATFHADRVCFDAAWTDLRAHATAWVSPEDDIEFRRVELHNLGERTLDVELISAFDVTLTETEADEAHPAFTGMFVRSAWQSAQQALVFERRPRLAGERGLHAAHFLADTDPQALGLRVQTDRQRWLGRNGTAANPQASLAVPRAGSDADLDTGLDPVCALAVQLRLAPGTKATLTFATAAADDAGTLAAIVDKYRQANHVERASLMSATLAGIRLHGLGIAAEDFVVAQSLCTALLLGLTRVTAGEAGVCDRRLLWRFGISGDRPLILVAAGALQGLGLLRSLAQVLQLWSWAGVACDLVVLNAEAVSYQMDLQRAITALAARPAAEDGVPPPSARLHALRSADLSADEASTLRCLARVRLVADGRALTHHVQAWLDAHEDAFDERHGTSTTTLALAAAGAAVAPAPVGAFDAASGDFGFDTGARLRPVRPWINVLANRGFGALQSEAGGGYTWALNSRLMQLTAGSNDPVADTPAEWLLLQDRRSGQAWSAAPSAWGDSALVYRVEHGQGETRIGHRRGAVEVSVSWCVDAETAVKQVRLQLVNHGPRALTLRAVAIAEWAMGARRADRATVHSSWQPQRPPARRLTALLATQREREGGFGDGTAFLALAGEEVDDWTCDRRECFDARGRLVLPDHFGQRSGSGLDPCAALSTDIPLAPGASAERVFLLGYAGSPDGARRLAAQPAAERVATTRAGWDRLLGATTVATPDPLFDALVNRWLLYQTVACRMWAKAGFYQAGGATGYRDQLQDAMALAWAAPALLREQIVLCASRQFAAGDVQHWWHAPGGAGVRTHFSDDLLWLAHACVHYLHATGDAALLDEHVPFLEGAAIPDGAEDVYDTPRTGSESGPVYEHAARAIDRSLRVGVHGLPLMGSGDWNDGMNRVGHEGRGESVWLGWFLCRLVAHFAPLAHERGEHARALRWETAAAGWTAALLGPAWDGQWFKRAFFDDGQPLGSHTGTEARIDLIAQAWAVLSGVAPPGRQRQAMAAVEALLVDREAGLIRLLDPPLAHSVPSPGYIQAYPPGVRENGGQYSHAGVWALMARAELGDGAAGGTAADLVWRDFTWLSPAHRAHDPAQGAHYGLEPYVMAGDVYSQPPYAGRGGWSWYTGAAGWMHRAAIESIFGLRLGAVDLCFRPCLPSHWPQAELTLRRAGRTLRFTLRRGTALAELRAGAPADAQLLWPGQALAWARLTADAQYLIPLIAPAP